MSATVTREKILRTADGLFYREGFHAVGLDRIIDEAGITKTTFYNHFESKDALLSETLKWHDRWWRDTFREMLRRHGGDTARGQLSAVFDAIEETLKFEGFNGCFFVHVAVQFPNEHDPAHMAAAEHKRAMIGVLREVAGYAGAEDAAGLAEELSLVIEGAYVTRQVTGNQKAGAIARRVGTGVIERHLGKAVGKGNRQ